MKVLVYLEESIYHCKMNKKRYIKLSEEESSSLQLLYKTSNSHRVRQRSQCLLLSSSGKDIESLSTFYSVKRDTICAWFKKWESQKAVLGDKASSPLAGVILGDLPRSGRPSLLSDSEKKT